MGKHTELHNEIMNLQIGGPGVSIAREALTDSGGLHIAYKIGHRDARHAAAELAAIHEHNHNRLVEALRKCIEALSFDDKGDRLLTAMNYEEMLTELGETE